MPPPRVSSRPCRDDTRGEGIVFLFKTQNSRRHRRQKLLFIQLPILPVLNFHQGLMRTKFLHLPFVEHQNIGRLANGAETVRDDDARAAGDEFFDGVLDNGF